MMEHGPAQGHELLREIAETINGAYEMEPMLDSVLQALLKLTELEAGWIFLTKPGVKGYRCAADAQLPPALEHDGKRPMREGCCWCLDRFQDGRLHHAVNILNCKRLEDAVRFRWGDTRGISHHASIPLRSGEELFGILNVASPGKTHFTAEELALLQSIAYQIGTAAHRIRLYRMERKRAELFARLGQAARQIGTLQESRELDAGIVRSVREHLSWPFLLLLRKESLEIAGVLQAALSENRTQLWREGCAVLERSGEQWRSGAAVPVVLHGKPLGVLAAGSPDSEELDAIDAEVLEALAAHVALVYDSVRLNEKSRELARWEERNRIARDLHDSVSQMLFSLSLHAKGLAHALPDAPEQAKEALAQVQRLSQAATGEMRAMIRQLRPTGLEEGLLTGLKRYGEQIGLRVAFRAEELRGLPERLEDVLWRIGQEALNNVRKHAGTNAAEIELSYTEWEVCMTVTDSGGGLPPAGSGDMPGPASGLGMTTMRERAEAVGGTLSVKSGAEFGTQVTVRLPL
ncbi:GAF domain-containing protein [Paenibacillus chartarius]|uniref:Oxygen sensor histidine kinase NreB n=1 Tax=Paenibacillus chartarius TaxID=747481 RepID=A0ABV6DHX7_9BACL